MIRQSDLARRAVLSHAKELFCLTVIISITLNFAYSTELSGKVVAVADGDTMTVLVDKHQVKVRLTEIDAPESKQAFGRRLKQSLASVCF